jgi:hypothetical protein
VGGFYEKQHREAINFNEEEASGMALKRAEQFVKKTQTSAGRAPLNGSLKNFYEYYFGCGTIRK